MARQTRAERRARREARERSAVPVDGGRKQQTLRTAPPMPKAEPAPRHVPGSGGKRFVSESWAELKKVEWPSQTQVITGTTVVLIACVIVGVFLWINDLIWQRFVQNVLLGQ